MSERSQHRQGGFSVLEAVISLTIFLVLLGAVFTVYTPSRVIYRRGTVKVNVQQNARLGISEMVRQIRLTGYFPENFTDPPPGTLVDNPILVATDSALAVHGDADGSGASNVFLFCLDGNVLRRGRAAIGEAAAYTCSSGEVLAENVIDLQFTYYDADGNPVPNPPAAPFTLDAQGTGGVPDLTDLSQRESVRRVVVTLTASLEAAQRGPQTTQLTSDVLLRNVQ